MEQNQHGKTYPEIESEVESQHHPPAYNWSGIFKGAWHEFSPVYLPNLWVTLAFALIGPGIGLVMKSPKVIIYGSGVGVCVLVLVFTHFLARQLSEDSKSKANIQPKETKSADKVVQPSSIHKSTNPLPSNKKPPAIEVHQTAYSPLSNDQLKKEVLNLVDKMRNYLDRKNLHDRTKSDYYSQQMRQAKTEAERQIIWDAQTHELTTATPLNFEYSEKFKAEATLLHDELLRRLPIEPKDNPMRRADYEHPTNPIGLNMVIDDLERLAKSLPK